MDFIIKRLNSYIEVSDSQSVERQTLMRERVEYMLFLALGVLWNEQLIAIDIERRMRIVGNLYRMSIGEVISAIRDLDCENKVLSKRQLRVLDKYPELRNSAFGHGYTHADMEKNLERELDELYNELIEFDFYSEKFDFVEVTKSSDDNYEGIRYPENQSGMPEKWICPQNILGEGAKEGDIYILDAKMIYRRISPFIIIRDRGESIYVFQSLEDKLSGKTKNSRLFKSETMYINVSELVSICSQESDRRRISANGTYMNYYECNYKKYISTPIEKNIKEFLLKNRSNVQATIWGHGGVGKTACVQNVCMELFDDFQGYFSYIVFVSAKDRQYDTSLGKIAAIEGIRTYTEVLDKVLSVIYDEEYEESISEKEERIKSLSSRILIVIDDYETFEDTEKTRIQKLINGLNIDYFKVIITTRNKRFSSGIEIKMDEFSKEETKSFLLSVFEKEYRGLLSRIKPLLLNESNLNKIYEVTSGRALFLYQFAILYAQKGIDLNDLIEIKNGEDAKEFLYGRLYDYLGETAQKEFMIISQIIDENDLIFKEEVLCFLLNDEDANDLEDGIQELLEQKIIEKYDSENDRVYSRDMVSRMEDLFDNANEKFKDSVRKRLRTIGGKRIKGTVFEAMLDEANSSRFKGNVMETLQKYKQILNDKKCEKVIKKKALLNLTSFVNINLADNEQTIQIMDDYVEKLDFQNDVDVINMYVQYLWRSDDVAKEKACDILDRFFRNKAHRKTNKKYFELFARATSYLSHNVIENTPERVKNSAENRILNEYGEELYNYISDKDFKDFKPSVRHNVSLAMIATTKVAMDLMQRGYDKSELIKSIKVFGMRNFNDIFRSQLSKLENNENNVIEGEIISARVTYVARYGLLVEIKDVGKAIIHNTEIDRGQMSKIEVGDTVRAKVIGQNEKGYILSMKSALFRDNDVQETSYE